VPQTIDHSKAMDSLRISDAQAEVLFNELESVSLSSPESDQRGAPRASVGSRARVIVQLRPLGGAPMLYLARPRNISRNGIAFLHGGYVHEGVDVIIQMKLAGESLHLNGQVVPMPLHLRGNS
jgi:hypothetical protein